MTVKEVRSIRRQPGGHEQCFSTTWTPGAQGDGRASISSASLYYLNVLRNAETVGLLAERNEISLEVMEIVKKIGLCSEIDFTETLGLLKNVMEMDNLWR